MTTGQVYISADHNLTITGLHVVLSGVTTYLNTATCTYIISSEAGVPVTGGTGTLTYVAASNGNYLGTIESTVTALMTEGVVYFIDVTIVQGSYNDFRRLRREATYREEL